MTENNGQVAGLGELFSAAGTRTTFGGANQLQITAQLTSLSADIASKIMHSIQQDPVGLRDKVLSSQKEHEHMDDLIAELYPLETVDVEFLKGIDADELDKAIRSQQSKRSRAKSKSMTPDNYKTMLIGAVAENLLRLASGKAKNSGGMSEAADVGYTEEKLAEFAADPEELKKAIRNVQSKKSIMKSKAGFSELNNPRWEQLLVVESQLKALRDQGAAALSEEARKALEDKETVSELLADVDVENLPQEEMARILHSVKELLVSR